MDKETKKYLVTDGPIGADRIYRNGEEIELEARAAARLLNEKKIFPVISQEGDEDESLKDKSKGSTKGGKK